MATVLAVQVSDEEARFVTARSEPGRPIILLGMNRVSLLPTEEGVEPTLSVVQLPDVEIDSTIGMMESSQVLYTTIELPFRDPKKIEQVASLQIQDTLPFDLDDFLLDSVVAGRAEQDRYRILSTMVPKARVAKSLSICQSLGADPRVMTTGAASLAELALLCHPDQIGLRGYLEIATRRVSLVILSGTELIHFRDFALTSMSGGLPKEILQGIACSVNRAVQDLGVQFQELFILGEPEKVDPLRAQLPYTVSPLDINRLVVNDSPDELELDEISWSIGLVALEAQRSKRGERRLLDLRRGPFAFQRAWQDLWSAFQPELFYIALATVLGLLWLGGRVYTDLAKLNEVDTKIAEVIAQVLPGEAVPFRDEAAYLQGKLDTLENDLRGLGSLASLSPLEALKELTSALGGGLDVSLDVVNVGASRLLLRGSVAENRQVADLSAALKARQKTFCGVSVDNKGKTAGGRVGFTAEITLCD